MHSGDFRTLFRDLATLTSNTAQPEVAGFQSLEQLTSPIPMQHRAFDLLGVSPMGV